MTPRYIEIDGKFYSWSDILERRRAQVAASAKPQQPALFELIDDRRASSQSTAAGRYAEPSLFDN